MTYVRSFLGFAPPPRYEEAADPFTEVLIEEAQSSAGEFLVIETVELDPVDTDPANPQARDFTTDAATQDPGFYRLTWKDAGGQTFTGGIIRFPSLPVWAPSVREVAALLRARTKIPGGQEVGTFNSNTRPTGEEVELLIAQGVSRVVSAVGATLCDNADLKDAARRCAALYTAMLVEQSYWPEQTRSDSSSFKSMQSLFTEQIKTLTEQVAETCGGGGDGGDATGGDGQMPAGGFDDGLLLIGRDYPVW